MTKYEVGVTIGVISGILSKTKSLQIWYVKSSEGLIISSCRLPDSWCSYSQYLYCGFLPRKEFVVVYISSSASMFI